MEGIEAIKRQKEIEKALHRFTADADLQECCQSLLDCLNIKYTIIDPSTQAASFFFARTSVENNEDLLGKISNMAVVGVATHETYTPEEIYYKILFEMFNADIELDDSIEHRKDMSLLQTSVIWNTLFNYQQKGVISLIKMLRKYNGAILADAVGLGKTFSALAVIKYFQTQGYTTLVLCPKKLEQNWTQYQRRHDSPFMGPPVMGEMASAGTLRTWL